MSVTIDVKELLENAVHFGHKKQKWNPKMRDYIYAERDGIHIFDLQKTADLFVKALDYLKQEVAAGKNVLFVCTKPQAMSMVSEMAQKCGMPFVVEKWIPGLLTNYSTVSKRIHYLQKLKEEKRTGEFSKYTKKEAGQLNKMIQKLERALGGVQSMVRLPDILFVFDSHRDTLALQEAQRTGITTVGVVDTNANPDLLDYVIPGNDDAVKSIKFILGKVEETVVSAKGRKS